MGNWELFSLFVICLNVLGVYLSFKSRKAYQIAAMDFQKRQDEYLLETKMIRARANELAERAIASAEENKRLRKELVRYVRAV